jgi:ATP-dependent RNA helicase DeaD
VAPLIRPLCGLPPLTFSDLQLRPELQQTVADLGYTDPSPIQAALIPVLLSGRDAVGQARTGTGKTAAFALPLLNRLYDETAENPAPAGAVRALVLTPTRELAVQVSSAVHAYGQALGVRTLPVTGGQPYHKQIQRLQRGVDVVVATPGRLVDLMNQNAIDLSHVQTVVLDEADEMFSMGFAEDLDAILGATPKERQTVLLSATMPHAVRKLADRTLRDPETITMAGGADKTGGDIEQRAHLVHGRDKLAAIVRILEMESVTSALVFVRTRVATSGLAADLQAAGFAAEALSGEMSQGARTDVLNRFRSQNVQLLVATDVAARGLDVDHVSHVFNVDLPVDVEAYVHRVGRTGRAGRTGVAISLVAPNDRNLLRRIEGYAKRQIPFMPLPSIEEVEAKRQSRLVDAVEAALETTPSAADQALVVQMIAAGRDPMEVAVAAIAMARAAQPNAPLMPIQEVRIGRPADRSFPTERSFSDRPGYVERPAAGPRGRAEAGMVRLALDAGHDDGVRANMVVSAIARTADIPGRALGKILIQDRTTLVDVPEEFVERVLAQSGDVRFGKRLATVQVAN